MRQSIVSIETMLTRLILLRCSPEQPSVSNQSTMASDVLPTFCGVDFLTIFTFFMSVSGVGSNVQKFGSFTGLACDGSPVCLESKPNRSLWVGSKVACGLECQKQQPALCVGVNYRQYQSTCDIFFSTEGITNSSNFTRNNAGCQYLQVGTNFVLVLMVACVWKIVSCILFLC